MSMRSRRIVLEDGRYLIYYTFEDDDPVPGNPPEPEQQEPPLPEEKTHE